MQQVADGLKPWIRYWHGLGESTQWEFYRCKGCRSLVNWHRIRQGGCPCDLGHQVVSALRLTFWEKTRILVFPWTVGR